MLEIKFLQVFPVLNFTNEDQECFVGAFFGVMAAVVHSKYENLIIMFLI